MKILAIYLIIAGHCLVPGYKYVYVFSVPAFFIMSGFLSKKEVSFGILLDKMWWNLIVPMIFLFFIHVCYESVFRLIQGEFDVIYVGKRFVGALIGMQKPGLGVLWFIYTLIICKIILQILPSTYERKWLIACSALMVAICYVLNRYGLIMPNSIINTLLAMPFFVIGYFLKPYKQLLTKCRLRYMPLLLLLGTLGILICGNYNDYVYLYKCTYGSSLLLCFLGGMAGTALLYALSRLLEGYLTSLVRVVGGGMILILGLHGILMSILSLFYDFQGLIKYLEPVLIILIMVPVIIFVKKYVPVLYGYKRL